MEIAYRLSQEDFAEGRALYRKAFGAAPRPWRERHSVQAAVVLAAVSVVVRPAWLWLTLGAGCLLWSPWRGRRLAEYQRRAGALRGRLALEMDGDGLRVQTASHSSSELVWTYLMRSEEGGHCFLLYSSPKTFTLLPKRVLTPEQIEIVREHGIQGRGRGG